MIWRPFNIITPYEAAEAEQGISHVFADFIGNMIDKRMNPLPIFGDGEQIRCFTWIDDVASAIAEHSFSEAARNEIFHLGNPEPLSMRELALMIFDEAKALALLPEAGGPLRFESVRSFADDVLTRIPDVTKAAEKLGWHAKVKAREAVRRCLREKAVLKPKQAPADLGVVHASA